MKVVIFTDTSIIKYMAFVEAAKQQSFTKAAEKLNYSQSGISRMISDLENQWNVTLLERSRSGVFLTSEGLRLLPYAKKICGDFELMLSELDELREVQTGIIRIGTFSSVATHWIPKIIKAFQTDFPGIEYELLLGDYSEIESWLSDGRVDCGFLRTPTVPDFSVTELEKDSFFAVLPPGHRLSKKESVSLSELCDDPFLLLDKGEGNDEILKEFKKRRLSPQIRFTTWDDYAVMAMVENGLGISVLPKLILKRIPYKLEIRPLKEDAHRTIAFAVRKNGKSPVAVRHFSEYLEKRNP
ncbi:MAG: LysR family transcriptional regulator [Clostridia bacterium]|nr:LysR family transcriptional regulator [Clostridia bacterium]